MLTRLLLFVVLCAPFAKFRAQQQVLHWNDISGQVDPGDKPIIAPQKYRSFTAENPDALKEVLKSFSGVQSSDPKTQLIIPLPLPDGTTQRFRVIESPLLPAILRNAFPEIRSFSLKGVDDPYATGKLDWNVFGLHAMVTSPKGSFFIDPFSNISVNKYISYYTHDFEKSTSLVFSEENLDELNELPYSAGFRTQTSDNGPCIGSVLLNYRLAIACTHEYAVAVTGFTAPTMVQTLSKIVVTINRVNGVFEREVGIRLLLVPTTTAVIFYSPDHDAFTANSNLMKLIVQSQKVIDSLVGTKNYDIGHTLSTGGGGLAQIGSICIKNKKAQAATGSSKPTGDPFDIDYVAHEMGHQLGASHTFNAITGNCNGNRKALTATEPGSGITIMGYAGICGMNNLGSNSIAYFHAKSYDEIINRTRNTTDAGCYIEESTGNNHPLVMPLPSQFTIPRGTPFMLSGSAFDPDGDSLTYSWEEVSPAPSAANWNADVKPYFRSYAPSYRPIRYFPSEEVLRSGDYTGTPGEFLSSKAQRLSFRLTVRDNHAGVGGVCADSTTVVMSIAGPFSVSVPSNAGIVWGQKTLKEITWEVNATDAPPLSCSKVDILCSTDNGKTYFPLKLGTLNDGSEVVQVPAVASTMNECRIMVRSVGNIFFDVSNSAFTISPDSTVGLKDDYKKILPGWKVMPNPFSNELRIIASQKITRDQLLYKVNDLTGREVARGRCNVSSDASFAVDLSVLADGMYLLELTDGAFTEQHRVVKE